MSDNVSVYVRIRPNSTPFDYQVSENTIKLIHPQKQFSKFKYDHIFDQSTSQDTVFNTTARPIINYIFKGYNATILAYGQTGSGKTHTMMGNLSHKKQYGIIAKTFDDIFSRIWNSSNNYQFSLSLSFLEIYNNELFDLLPNNQKLNKCKIRDGKDDKIFVENLNEISISSLKQAFQLIQKAMQKRKKSQTDMNKDSSRSHAVLTLKLEQEDLYSDTKTMSKLHLVDLAGSEKIKKSGAKGQQIKEALNINKSLSALGNCIKAVLDTNSIHIPFRESSLTRLLRDSLGGNCKTAMIINISAGIDNIDETLTSLRFGQRAKQIKTKARINNIQSRAQLTLQLQQVSSKFSQLLLLINDMTSDITNSLKNDSLLLIGNSQSYNQLYALKKEIKSYKYKHIIDPSKLDNILSLKNRKKIEKKQVQIRQQKQQSNINNVFNWKNFPKSPLLFEDNAQTCGKSNWMKSDSSQPSEIASGMSSLGIMPALTSEQEMKDKEVNLYKNFTTFDPSDFPPLWQTFNEDELDTIAKKYNMNPEIIYYAQHLYEINQSDYSSNDDDEDTASPVINETTIIQYTNTETVTMLNVAKKKIKMGEFELRTNKKQYTSELQTLTNEIETLKQLIHRMNMKSTENVPRMKTILKGNQSFVNDSDEKFDHFDANNQRLYKPLKLKEFIYKYDFDKNGLFYDIINNKHLGIDYVNVTSSQLFNDKDCNAAINILKTDPSKFAATVHRPSVYINIKLMNGIRFNISKYSIMHPSTLTTDFMRNWNLDASNDGTNWTTLSTHNNDTMPRIGPQKHGKCIKYSCSWDVQSAGYFSEYRLVSTGSNSSKEQSLVVGGIEFYGTAAF
eukprot:534093_1